MADANATVEASLDRANRLFSSGLGGTLGILKEADAELSKGLHKLTAKPGQAQLRFTEAHALLYRKQIRLVNAYLEKRLLGHTHEQAVQAIQAGTKSTIALAKKLEKQFTGIVKPLQLESQQMQDSIVRGTAASLLRQHQTSVARYGVAMVEDMERVMRVGFVAGLNNHQVISRLVQQGELGGINAASLHAGEPKYFPKPSGYVTRRYWAERIVRTEKAYAYNAANQATISTAKVVDFPDMQKKILAHFDFRTAPDSIAVHGQIRPVDGLFTDGAGRMYKHPPARPNDRETVIPWRPHWTELPATKAAPPEAQAAAKAEAAPGLGTAAGPQNLVQASKAQIVAMVKKAKAEQKEQTKGADAAQKFQLAQAAAQRAQVRGTKLVGSAKLADSEALAKAQALQQAKGTKLKGQSPAELKAKAEAYKAEIAAKAVAKAAEREAARAAAMKAKALKVIEAQKAIAGSPEALVSNLKDLSKYQPALFAQVQKAAGVTVVHKSPKAAALHLAKKIAPELDYSSFKPKPKAKPVVAPPAAVIAPKLPPLEFKEVSGYIDIHDAGTGQKLAYLKPADGGKFGVTPPATLAGFEAKVFASKEEAAPYALKVSAAIQLQKAEAAAAAAKIAAMTKAEQDALKAAKHADQRKAYADLMAEAKPGRSRKLAELVHARPPENNTEPEDFETGLGVSRSELMKSARAFERGINSTQRDAVKSFSGSGYTGVRRDEAEGRKTVSVKALASAFETPRPLNDAADGLQVWRGISGISKRLIEKWLDDGELDHGGTASSSWGRSTAFGFAGVYENDDGTFGGDGTSDAYKVVYRWANKSGRSIESISSHTGEREVLQPKKARFSVRAAYRPTGTRHMVFFELEEQ